MWSRSWILVPSIPTGIQKFESKKTTTKIRQERKMLNLDFLKKSSVIRQKGESQNGSFKKTKHAKFSEKRTFLTPWYGHVRVRIKG